MGACRRLIAVFLVLGLACCKEKPLEETKKDEGTCFSLKQDVMRELTSSHPELALALFEKIGSGSQRKSLVQIFFGSLREFSVLSKVPDYLPFKEDLLSVNYDLRISLLRVSDKDFDKINVEALPKFAQRVYWESFGKKNASEGYSSDLLANVPSEFAAKAYGVWLAERSSSNPEQAALEYSQGLLPEDSAAIISSNYALYKPEKAVEWSLSIEDPAAIRVSSSIWASMNISEAAQWVTELPHSLHRDVASYSIVTQLISVKDFESAKEWSQSISDSTWKENATLAIKQATQQ